MARGIQEVVTAAIAAAVNTWPWANLQQRRYQTPQQNSRRRWVHSSALASPPPGSHMVVWSLETREVSARNPVYPTVQPSLPHSSTAVPCPPQLWATGTQPAQASPLGSARVGHRLQLRTLSATSPLLVKAEQHTVSCNPSAQRPPDTKSQLMHCTTAPHAATLSQRSSHSFFSLGSTKDS